MDPSELPQVGLELPVSAVSAALTPRVWAAHRGRTLGDAALDTRAGASRQRANHTNAAGTKCPSFEGNLGNPHPRPPQPPIQDTKTQTILQNFYLTTEQRFCRNWVTLDIDKGAMTYALLSSC